MGQTEIRPVDAECDSPQQTQRKPQSSFPGLNIATIGLRWAPALEPKIDLVMPPPTQPLRPCEGDILNALFLTGVAPGIRGIIGVSPFLWG